MKTTIDIPEALLQEAKQAAARDGETLRSLVEQGLRKVLAQRQPRAEPFKLQQISFGLGGLRPEAAHLAPHELIHFGADSAAHSGEGCGEADGETRGDRAFGDIQHAQVPGPRR